MDQKIYKWLLELLVRLAVMATCFLNIHILSIPGRPTNPVFLNRGPGTLSKRLYAHLSKKEFCNECLSSKRVRNLNKEYYIVRLFLFVRYILKTVNSVFKCNLFHGWSHHFPNQIPYCFKAEKIFVFEELNKMRFL